MRRVIVAILAVIFAAALFVAPASAAPVKKDHKSTKTAKAKPSEPGTKTEKGLAVGAGKAGKFVQRTFTVPQKNPKHRKRSHNRKQSNLVKGVHTSAHKTGKWIKGRTKIK